MQSDGKWISFKETDNDQEDLAPPKPSFEDND